MWGSKERERERKIVGGQYMALGTKGEDSLSLVLRHVLSFSLGAKNAFVNVIQQRHGQVAKIFFLSRRQQKNKISKG